MKEQTGTIPQYLTEKVVSEMTSIPLQSLRNMRAKREGLPYRKPPGSRRVRYLYDDVVAYMEACVITPVAE